MSKVEIIGAEFSRMKIEYGQNPQAEVAEAVASALGVLGVSNEFSIVTIRGDGPAKVGYPEFVMTVSGVLNGLSGLEPPRQLTDISYPPVGGDFMHAIITTQVAPQPQ